MTGNDEKTPLEIERKYLIRMPDPERLARESTKRIEMPPCSSSALWRSSDMEGEIRLSRSPWRCRNGGSPPVTYVTGFARAASSGLSRIWVLPSCTAT